MKHLPFFSILTFMLAGILACTQSGPTSENTPKPLTQEQALALLASHEIPASQASAAITAWSNVRSAIVPVISADSTTQNDAQFIARGFKVPMADLQNIMTAAGDTSKLWAMLAIQNSNVTIIFRIPDATGVTRYYDFTLPCPSNCPPASNE